MTYECTNAYLVRRGKVGGDRGEEEKGERERGRGSIFTFDNYMSNYWTGQKGHAGQRGRRRLSYGHRRGGGQGSNGP